MHKLLITGVACCALGLSGVAFAAGSTSGSAGSKAAGSGDTAAGMTSGSTGGATIGTGNKPGADAQKSDTTSQSKQPCPVGAADTSNCVKTGQ